MTLRRSAIERVGRFDEGLGGGGPQGSGDEAEWQRRWLASGGRIRYLAAAGVDHRRDGEDARLRSLCRAARARGRASRWADERRGPSAVRGARAADAGGLPVARAAPLVRDGARDERAHAGPVEAALRTPPPRRGAEDFLSGASGNVEGTRALARAGPRRARGTFALARRGRARRLAAPPPGPRVRACSCSLSSAATSRRCWPRRARELRRSRHEVDVAVPEPGTRGKFENLNLLLRDATSPRTTGCSCSTTT